MPFIRDEDCQDGEALAEYLAVVTARLKQQGGLGIRQEVAGEGYRFNRVVKILDYEPGLGMRGEALFVFSAFSALNAARVTRFSAQALEWARTDVNPKAAGQAFANFRMPTHFCFAIAITDRLDAATRRDIKTTNPIKHRADLLWYEVPLVYELANQQLHYYAEAANFFENFRGEVVWQKLRPIIQALFTAPMPAEVAAFAQTVSMNEATTNEENTMNWPAEWTGAQLDDLKDALISAYPTEPKLKRLLRTELEVRLNTIAGGENYTDVVYSLIEHFESETQLPELITAAQRGNPRNAKLKAFVASLSSAANPRKAPELESMGPGFDWRGPTDERELEGLFRAPAVSYNMSFLRQANQAAGAICRIELPGSQAIGTGFLIAKNLLLTNYHVIAPDQSSDPKALLSDIALMFEYLNLLPENPSPESEAKIQTFKLAPQPLLRFKTVSQGLDYALLQIEDRILTVDMPPPPLPKARRLPSRGMSIHVLQHPNGQAMQAAFSNHGITGVYKQDSLIQYVSNTAGGSSGAPCFNDEWELIAMHHAQVAASFGIRCEGILFEAIYEDIADILRKPLNK